MSHGYAVKALHPILAFSFFLFSSLHPSADAGPAYVRSYSVYILGRRAFKRISVRVVMCSHTSYNTAKSASAHA